MTNQEILEDKTDKQAERLALLVYELSQVRVYNSANVFKGPMIKDKELVYNLVIRARNILEEMQSIQSKNHDS
jgi:hypothetical protein